MSRVCYRPRKWTTGAASRTAGTRDRAMVQEGMREVVAVKDVQEGAVLSVHPVLVICPIVLIQGRPLRVHVLVHASSHSRFGSILELPLYRPRRCLLVSSSRRRVQSTHRVSQARTARYREHFPGVHSDTSAARLPNVSLIPPISRRHCHPRSGAFSSILRSFKLDAALAIALSKAPR
ncbi:hypothetical protein EXIGLDRAFT_476981 [Exidia glandulosa HHB12029]|uniref:Uncharacterized protein n=1 Tax=Exidia glandulosa HHB12029 TaxID=1314781 RepID=A0A166NK32_EXIGL|nr:hypothetical protein EXIGLDRAFT_476981 [Exidia glandulosa HHB12029]